MNSWIRLGILGVVLLSTVFGMMWYVFAYGCDRWYRYHVLGYVDENGELIDKKDLTSYYP